MRPPSAAATAPRPSGPLPRWADLKAIADAQRLVLLTLLVGILAIPGSIALAAVVSPEGGGTAAGVLGLAVVAAVVIVRVWMAVAVYRLARALGSRLAVLWAIGAFLPNLIGLIVLVVVSSRATSRLRKAGLKVGLLGAKLADRPPPGFLCEELAGAFS